MCRETTPLESERIDTMLDGNLMVIQSSRGYRFSVDALLLSDFALTRPGDVVVDLGTGCGVISLLLLKKGDIRQAVGIEIQPELASQAFRNAVLNGLSEKMHVVIGDMKDVPVKKGCADIVVCNPPYRSRSSGRISPDPVRAIARHELTVSLEDILKASSYMLKRCGRAVLIYPSARLADLISGCRRYHLEPKRLQMIHPSGSSPAVLSMVEAVSGGRFSLKVLAPIIGQGRFTI